MRIRENSLNVVEKVQLDDERKDFGESLRHSLLVVLLYTFLAVIIFVVGKFVWWFGFALFLIFAANTLSRLVFVGGIFVLVGFVIRIAVRFVRFRGLDPARFDEMLHLSKKLFWTNVLLGSVELYFVVMTTALGVSFFW